MFYCLWVKATSVPVFCFLVYFGFLLDPRAFMIMAAEMKKKAVYKILNGDEGVEEGIVCFVLLFRYVVWVQVFLYQRTNGVFLGSD